MPESHVDATAPSRPVEEDAAGEKEEGLEAVARSLAGSHQAAQAVGHEAGHPAAGGADLLKRLPALATLLQESYHYFAHTSDEELALSYAAEWLLDNYYVVQQAIRLIQEDLPPGYYRELPRLSQGLELAGYPRVYDVARKIVAHDACQVDANRLRRFIGAYQELTPLTMGELWALPLMLQLAILEGLAQALTSITGLSLNETATAPPQAPLPDQAIGDQEIVANCIASLHSLSRHDWKSTFEEMSLVEQCLRRDPAAIYAHMDFDSRDRYRKVVEKLAPGSQQSRALSPTWSEVAVAGQALELAQQRADGRRPQPGFDGSNVEAHVGYYLLGSGLAQLEQRIGHRPPARERLRRWLFAHPTLVYLGSAGLATWLLLALLLWVAAAAAGPWQRAAAALLLFIPALSLAVSLVNWLITNAVSPRTLPKLDFEAGLPPACRAAVVIPAMLSSAAEVQSLLKQLELHYLRNPDPNLCFALLTDFADAAAEKMPEDERLLAEATAGVEMLNRRYEGGAFYLLHRRRLWNAGENVWMGWERKRGKLHEFNRLLRGDGETSYVVQVGEMERLGGAAGSRSDRIAYVITLDADTVLPPNSALKLVGALAHPLNRARFDAASGRVVAGYTILQPRTEVKPTSAGHSLFSRVFAGDAGLDLYTRAVSDVYQDLFGEGLYVGKGIYDVDAFERSLAGRVPENSLLSHDHFEGIHGRVGLVTDVVLYEDYPPHYLINVRRSYRWVRGDWQLLPWLLPWAPAARPTLARRRGWLRNPLRPIDRWQIADNLRRSLLPPALIVLLASGWTWLAGGPLLWTALALLLSAAPVITSVLDSVIQALSQARPGRGRGRPLGQILRPIGDSTIRWLLFLAFLPYEALLNLDAIGVTLLRLAITRRNLLQWTTAAHTARLFGREVGAEVIHRQMVSSLALVVSLGLLVYLANPAALSAALPLLLLWLLAPEIAHWISRPVDALGEPPLNDGQRRQLRLLARRTWLFFEQFVGPDDNWLPPDHFQEWPRGVVAHRTSPTNIGLYLATMLAAHDLGYIGAMNLALRLRSTLATLDKLERYRGHFLNWIDTGNLAPLAPRYVSTVDSGNLAACLLVLKQACLAIQRQPVWRWQRWQGLLDTLSLLEEAVADQRPLADAAQPLRAVLDEMRRRIVAARQAPEEWAPLLKQLRDEEQPKLEQRLLELVEAGSDGVGDGVAAERLRDWRMIAERARHHLHEMQRQLDLLLPWLLPMGQPPALFRHLDAPAGAAPIAQPALASPALSEVEGAWKALQQALSATPATSLHLGHLGPTCAAGESRLAHLQQLLAAIDRPGAGGDGGIAEAIDWCTRLNAALAAARTTIGSLLSSYEELAQEASAYVEAMDFGFLFDNQRQVFHIGYNLESGRLDNNYYDLLASEARIASLVAIAKNDAPYSHWLHLGRPLSRSDLVAHERLLLLSWSGTMFEYLMPPLFMASYPGTLLYQSSRAAVAHQIRYGQKRGVPWGISESGFYAFDAAMNYQYRAFGAPGLGLKRGLAEDLVITPYASLMALPIRPQAVMANIQRLARRGMLSRYGFYEAIDFTPSRLPLGQEEAIVRSYMSHHQGMIMMALANYLQEERLVSRFHAEPAIQSVELLLQEQIPAQAPLNSPHLDETASTVRPAAAVAVNPWGVAVESPMPLVHYLANGRFGALISNAGAGYSHWQEPGGQEIALTRWRADTTLDNWGCWLYLQDRDNDALWSAAIQPTLAQPESHHVRFHAHMAEFRRRDHDVNLEMLVTVAPDDDVEIRRLTLTNESQQRRRLRLTTYGEVVLAEAAADLRHPAFARLFVESEYVAEYNALLFRRRPRSAAEKAQYLLHMLVLEQPEPGQEPGQQQPAPPLTRAYDSDRARFLGRGGTAQRPAALLGEQWLSATAGATLDPIMALGQNIELEAGASIRLAILTLAAGSRQEALALAERYQQWVAVDRAFRQAQAQAERELRRLNFTTADLEQTQQLLSLLLYPHPARRADAATLAANDKGQPGLWPYAISGDHPILLLRFHDEAEGELLQALLRAHIYWRQRGLKIDLVILNEQESQYGQELQGYIQRMVQRLHSDNWLNRGGGIFILRSDQLGEGDHVLLQATAGVVLDSASGSLTEQLATLLQQPAPLPAFVPTGVELTAEKAESAEGRGESSAPSPPSAVNLAGPPLARPEKLQFDNGLGGFSGPESAKGGREYVIYLEPGEKTPAPWINVVANPEFGFLVSESGGGYTWAVNSGENRLTSWRNDPVADRPAEALYLRDEETAEMWSPTPRPAAAAAPYLVRHGAGYTIFEHDSHELKQRLHLFIAPDAPVKVVYLRLENRGGRPRRITATFYAEWVLGVERQLTQASIVPEYERRAWALLARNAYNVEFGGRVAFLAASKEPHGLTANRTEFLGRLGSLERPAALARIGLGSHVEAGLDPCAALQVHLDLEPGASEDVYFLLGQGADREEALALIQAFQDPNRVTAAWQATQDTWEEILGALTVNTPDPAMNLLLNRWLLYQTLACRVWGRSALYQSSGAYGFRDQLQDVMALIFSRPELAREHILRAAAQQFEAGDVLHWWHPPSGRGVRSRISDDLLWLPYVTAYYVKATGDEAILDEAAPFLTGKPLAADEEERYGLYQRTEEQYSLYEHCRRALEKGATVGRRGLPLIGGGDWNDGMNRVGSQGKGESVWLGWFLYDTLTQFADLCQGRDESEQAEGYRQEAEAYRLALEANGWDGRWYRRAYYDDGTPLGSAGNRECQIDAIAQSWAVLSGAAGQPRAGQAMQSVLEQLVRWDERLILLFNPPFDQTPKDPGYIKGYLPGIRENGGQYTHAALWTIWALAQQGDASTAESLFRLINPIYRADTPEKAAHYKVEPYVISADVYAVPPHAGRGGWTWYTGSSGWMYRLGIEAILGLRRTPRGLHLDPRIPKEWPGYTITYRYGRSRYEIHVENPDHVGQGIKEVTVDGQKQAGAVIPLKDDGRLHQVRALLGA